MATEEPLRQIRFGTMGVDWQERLDFARMRRERFERAQAAMKENGIAAMLSTMAENKRYTTGIRSAGHTGAGESFSLIFAEGPLEDSVIYEEASIYLAEQEHITWIKPENYRPVPMLWSHGTGHDFYKWWAGEFAVMVQQELKERKLLKEQLGMDQITAELKTAFETLNIKVVNTFNMMMDTRAVKTEDEIDCMKMSGAIVDSCYAAMIDALRPGIKECELAAVGQAALWRLGVEGVGGVTVRSGPNTAPWYGGRMPTDRIIQPGDLVYWDVYGSRYMGYGSCYYRTFKVGMKPTPTEKDWYKRTYDMLYAAVDVLKDGVTTADVAAKWPEASYWGYTDEMYVGAWALGHGQGLRQYEHPVITRHNSLKFPQPIKKNMIIAMETWYGQHKPPRGGCRLENIWVITEKGHENIYCLPDEEIICPPHAMYVS